MVTPGEDSNRLKLPILEVRVESMGGYVRAQASTDAQAARYRELDSRLEKTPFDPAVPYFLDEDPSKLRITGRRPAGTPAGLPPERPR